MPGVTCAHCAAFFATLSLSPDEARRLHNDCSRHRCQQPAAAADPGDDACSSYWDMEGFGTQAESQERGGAL